MRNLHEFELEFVSGAGCGCSPCPPTKEKKGNNGFGNGADANRAAPGNSGATGGGKAGSVGDDRGPR
jgi:hypothetical protein